MSPHYHHSVPLINQCWILMNTDNTAHKKQKAVFHALLEQRFRIQEPQLSTLVHNPLGC
jgi:uncharacterized tellurite resistance protein B-like protein